MDSVSCTYGGLPCSDPEALFRRCRELGRPTGPWRGRCNQFASHLGQEPGRGAVLMRLRDWRRLDREASHDLVFDARTSRVTLRSIIPRQALCALPGPREDLDAPYMVELADKRYLAAGGAVLDTSFNVRNADGTGYLSASLDGGSPWTWNGMLASVWNANGLMGAWPGLPYSPAGTPEGWEFRAMSSYDALGQLLEALGCALCLDPVADAWSVVRVADEDEDLDSALGLLDGRPRIWDAYPEEPARTRVPQTLKVFFPVIRASADTTGTSPYYRLSRTDPTAGGPLAGVEPGTEAAVEDRLPARFDEDGDLLNASDLSARADARAADYFRRIREVRLSRRFTGARDSLVPGPRLKGVVWGDRGGGLVTDAARFPGYGPADALLDGLPGAGEPSAFPGGGGGGAGPGGGDGGSDGAPGGRGPVGVGGGRGAGGAGGGSGGRGVAGVPGPGAPPGAMLAWLWPLLLPALRREIGLLLAGGGSVKYEAWFRERGSRYYVAGHPIAAPTPASTTADRLYALPFLSAKAGTLDQIGFNLQFGVAGKKVRLGIYTNASDTAPAPADLLVDSGEITTDAAGFKSVGIAQAVAAHTLYWLVFVGDNALNVRHLTMNTAWPILGNDDTLGFVGCGWYAAYPFAALPAAFPGGGTIIASGVSQLAPAIAVRYSA